MVIVSTNNTSDWTQAQIYNFAGVDILFQTPSSVLKAFHVEEASLELVAQASIKVQDYLESDVDEKKLKLMYEGSAPFGNRNRDFKFRRKRKVAKLELDDELVCEVDFQNNHIHLVRDGGFADLTNVELVTGPAMMIILARLKTYCLHASAVKTNAGVVAIIGESGVGKSTLGWHAGDSWLQVSDDILPVLYETGFGGVKVTDRFPQLKMEQATVPNFEVGSLLLDYIIRVNPIPSSVTKFRPLSKSEAMLQFIRHTVGAKLFDTRIMDRHAKFATYVAKRVPMIEVSYPRDLQQISDLREEIASFLKDFN